MIANPQAPPPLEVEPRDVEPYRRGNTGTDYVWRFDSGRPGPRVAVSGLVHGCELCGMTAVTWLLDRGVRPARGALTLWLANVAAYERFDPAQAAGNHTANRFVDRDFNRVWSDAIIDGDDPSSEVARARALRPFVRVQDALLDVHSTTFSARPFWIYRGAAKTRRMASAVGFPAAQVAFNRLGTGTGMLEYGGFADPAAEATALAVECGTHFARASGELAIQAALRFLIHHGTLERATVADALAPEPDERPQFYDVTEVYVARYDGARFVRPFAGFEELAAGEPILVDGDATLVAPFDRCAILMPRLAVRRGGEMVTLARVVD